MADVAERDRRPDEEPAIDVAPPKLPLIVAALSGVAALLYEIAWTRRWCSRSAPRCTAFTLILTAFILGLALGSALAALVLPRLRDLPTALGVLQIAVGGLAIALLPALGDLPLRIAPLAEGMRQDYGSMLATQTQYILLFVLAPTMFMGAVFPIAIRLASGSDRGVGRGGRPPSILRTRWVDRRLAGGSFALVPLVGLATTVRSRRTVNLALAAVLLLPRRWPAAIPVAAALLGWFLLPSWDPKVLASGPFIYGSADLRSAEGQKGAFRSTCRRQRTSSRSIWDS